MLAYIKKYLNKLTKLKNLSKQMYYKEAISQHKSNPKQLWKFI